LTNTMKDPIHAGIAARLQAASQPLLLSHIRPDGDALASLVGMGLALQAAGKSCQLVLSDGVPSKFRFLAGCEKIQTRVQPGYDLVIALDCSDKQRLGLPFSDLPIDINIDHHITNEHFAALNLVLPHEAATAAILAQFLPDWGFPLDAESSNALLMGILTDTIGFRTSNVSASTLRQAAHLLENGAHLTDLYEKALANQTFAACLLWGFSLSRLQKKDRLAWTSITLQDRQQAGYSGRDDADLTNVLSAIENIDISLLFNEQNNRTIKVSWRSGADMDVSKISQRFGGGGHPPAAGAEILGNLEEVEAMVLKVTNEYLKEKNAQGENEHGK